ncbi:helix-turn-helix transcriptional regulator [Kibdelosporangium aridum]|uniref:helix-turn-helix transcriptional regulator n=1 Tax=Kibdelosporangium aridum TaxID=2030 RepID=UPI0035EFC6FE
MLGELNTVLTERDAVFASLDRLLADASLARSRVAIVEGPVGSGKSALLHGFLEAVEGASTTVLRATASRRDQSVPLDVLAQLGQTTRLPQPLRVSLNDRLTAMMARASDMDSTDSTLSHDSVADLREILLALVDLAEDHQIVIGIDNLHYVDEPSLRCLSYLVARLQQARVLVVLTHDAGRDLTNSPHCSELLNQPHATRLTLDMLSLTGVTDLIACQLGEHEARRLAADFADVSGGNPLVLNNLIRDHLSGIGQYPHGYSRALFSCLVNSDPETLAIVRALAVLGSGASLTDLAWLAGVEEWRTSGELHWLNAAGLLRGAAFRHPAAAADIVGDMSKAERDHLRLRAAELLHTHGAPAAAVAQQLVAAGQADRPWACKELLAAAEDALATNRVRAAVDYFELARQTDADGPAKAAALAGLSRAAWQLDPLSADRYLDPLMARVPPDDLDPRDLVETILQLSWRGDIGSMTMLLDELERRGQQAQGFGAEDIQGISTWLTCLYPAYARARKPVGLGVKTPAEIPQPNPWLTAASLANDLVRGHSGNIAAQAEKVLETVPPDTVSLWSGEAVVLALLCLAYTDKLDLATSWCDRLLTDSTGRDTPTRNAVLTAVSAEIALREGDLTSALSKAEAAMTIVSPRGWGAALGLPLGCLILAAVRTGQLDLAAKYVALPFPEKMLESRYGLHYLYARGHYRLAAGHVKSALADFLSCGELTKMWAAHGACLVPWRIGAATAWLRLDNHTQAKQFARDQLSKIPPGSSRLRGLALCVLAATSGSAQRARLLEEAVELIEECGDRFELATALTDLSSALRDVGDHRNARRISRRAWHTAKACGAEALSREIAPEHVDDTSAATTRKNLKALATLSEREMQVATLAAAGYTNQEIAAQLFITASTVEQHLTRVFRKLNLKRRQDLACELPMVS